MSTNEKRTGVPRQVLLPVAVVQFALAGYAWVDLARRPRDLVRGPKPVWAAVIAINFVGPIVYLRFGRVRSRNGCPRPVGPSVSGTNDEHLARGADDDDVGAPFGTASPAGPLSTN